MSTFSLEIVSPEGAIVSCQCVEVNIPGSEGRFGVLASHMNFISNIKPGVVEIKMESGDTSLIAVKDGITEVNAGSCSILVEKAALPNQLPAEQINEQLAQLRHDLHKADVDTNVEKVAIENEIAFLESLLEIS